MIKNVKHTWERVKKPFFMIGLYKNWLTALCDRFYLVPSKPIVYTLRDGTQFLVQANTLGIRFINEIWIDRIYTPSGWQIGHDWVVIDLGANKGEFAIFAATKARQVIAVEANPETCQHCLENITRNELQGKIQVFQGVIANDEGESMFYIANESGQCSTILYDGFPLQKKIAVPKISIHHLLKPLTHVDLLKMDIEGSEFELLLSSDRTIWLDKVQRLVLEYHDYFPGFAHTVDELITVLEESGFCVHIKREVRLLYAEREL